MKLKNFLTALIFSAIATRAQQSDRTLFQSGPFTQTVRGQVTDGASKAPVVGATVQVMGSQPLLGTSADTEGRFRLRNVPTGRIRLKLTAVGYEDLLLNEVVVTSGKEVVLDVTMTESVSMLDEVTVAYKRSEDRTVVRTLAPPTGVIWSIRVPAGITAWN